jgi:glycosyltransferase involved in cell wall biosynthesis
VRSDAPRVLFVSQPIVPPWHDGPKNLVRDIARNLRRSRPTVMTTPDAEEVGPDVALDPVYREAARFAPAVRDGARLLRRLVSGDPLDLWHFVSVPDAASSMTARFARRARRVAGWKGPIVQTVAGAPRSFDGVGRAIFGDAVVVLSEWMRGRLLGEGVSGQAMRVIPPCAAAPRDVTEDEKRAAREKHGLGDGPIVVYPGDYDVSRGAETVARAVPTIRREVPGSLVVFACHAKTRRAARAGERIESALRSAGLDDVTSHLGEVDDMHALLAAATVVAFPVDDLYTKVDVPLVLLEALAMGVPMVLVRDGPLEAIDTASFVDPGDDAGLAHEIVSLLRDRAKAENAAERGRALYRARFRPEVVAAEYERLYEALLSRR